MEYATASKIIFDGERAKNNEIKQAMEKSAQQVKEAEIEMLKERAAASKKANTRSTKVLQTKQSNARKTQKVQAAVEVEDSDNEDSSSDIETDIAEKLSNTRSSRAQVSKKNQLNENETATKKIEIKKTSEIDNSSLLAIFKQEFEGKLAATTNSLSTEINKLRKQLHDTEGELLKSNNIINELRNENKKQKTEIISNQNDEVVIDNSPVTKNGNVRGFEKNHSPGEAMAMSMELAFSEMDNITQEREITKLNRKILIQNSTVRFKRLIHH